MTMRSKITLGRFALSGWMAITGLCADAASGDRPPGVPQFGLDVGYEMRASDNVALRRGAEGVEDIVHSPFVDVSALIDNARVDLDANYRWLGRYFQDGTFPDDNVVTGSGGVTVAVLPQRITWDARYTRSQQLRNLQQPDNPLNQREFDIYETGVLLGLLPPGPTTASLSARIQEQRSSLDFDRSQRVTTGLQLKRTVSSKTTLGLSADRLRVVFDEPFFPDYERLTGAVTFAYSGAALTLDGRVGYNEISFDEAEDSNGGESLGLSATWRLTGSQQLRLSASRELTDQTPGLGVGQLGFGDFRDQGAFGRVFEQSRAGVTWRTSRGRWNLSATANVSRQEFVEGGQSDIDRWSVGGNVGYRFTPKLSADLSLRLNRNEFAGQDREDEQLFGNLRFNWNPGPRTRFSLGLSHRRADSQAATFNFEETAAILTLSRTVLPW